MYFFSLKSNAGLVPSNISTILLFISVFSILPLLYVILLFSLSILDTIICSASHATAILGLCVTIINTSHRKLCFYSTP